MQQIWLCVQKCICHQLWKEWFMGNIFYPPVHGIMEAVQLKTIKRYAERDAQTRPGVLTYLVEF